MLVAKCYQITLVLEGGKRVHPKGAALHDGTGHIWPKNSVLIAPFKAEGRALPSPDKEAQRWSKTPENVRAGSVDLPPKPLGSWTLRGCVERIDYTRYGEHADKYTHKFDGHGEKNGDGPFAAALLFEEGTPHPILYSLRSIYRLELPKGAVFNWRGFVWP